VASPRHRNTAHDACDQSDLDHVASTGLQDLSRLAGLYCQDNSENRNSLDPTEVLIIGIDGGRTL
jgi:hypothetical protein